MKAILRFQLPATVGSDLAGVVLEVGHHVTRFKPGDAVLTSFVLVTCIFLFLTAPLFLGDKAPLRSASQAGPELTPSPQNPVGTLGRATYERNYEPNF